MALLSYSLGAMANSNDLRRQIPQELFQGGYDGPEPGNLTIGPRELRHTLTLGTLGIACLTRQSAIGLAVRDRAASKGNLSGFDSAAQCCLWLDPFIIHDAFS